MTNQEIIEWQRQYREWSLTRLGLICERALRTAYNDGHDGNSDVCSINRAKASADAAKSAAEELRTAIRELLAEIERLRARVAELESLTPIDEAKDAGPSPFQGRTTRRDEDDDKEYKFMMSHYEGRN